MRTSIVISTIMALALTCQPTSVQAATHARGARVARSGATVGRAVPRRADVTRPVVIAPRIVTAPSRVVVGRIAPVRVVAPRAIAVAPFRFVRPYYAFRPRLNLVFGLWVGYPVAYPYYAYAYPYPAYGYPAPYPYGYAAPAYPPAGPVTVQPGAPSGAGVSFEITPVDADVYLDGLYVGPVSNFGPLSQPLSVAPGRHHIEIRRPGYQTLSFDTDIAAGQVIPFQGAMQPGN